MKKKKLLLEELRSKDLVTVLNAVSNLRKQGDSADLNDIIELLHTSNNSEIKEAVSSFLCDLKEQNSVINIINAIKNIKYKNELEVLVSSCWQSGLDYSAYLAFFTDLVINEKYIVAVEAFTVIENMPSDFSEEEIENNISKIQTAIHLKEKEKSYLFAELIKVFERWKQ